MEGQQVQAEPIEDGPAKADESAGEPGSSIDVKME